jgi:pyruvate/2-oxoglutarate dehydrogenase complex dihydrolipoamide acyltransferase (E2) component
MHIQGKLLFGLLPGVLACASLPLSAPIVDVGACRSIEDSLERFACYEALGRESDPAPAAPTATPQAAPTPAPAPSVSRTPVPAPRSPVADTPAPTAPAPAADNAVAEFGLEASKGSGKLVENKHGEQELHATVAQIWRLMPTLLEITLENGQVWRQTQNKPYNLRVGDEVRIYPTRWGDAYRLTAPRVAGYIQVSRLR